MCKKYPLDSVRLSPKLYDTKERNAGAGRLKDCSQCSKRKQRKCRQKRQKGSDSNRIPIRKRDRILHLAERTPSPTDISGHLINAKHQTGIKLESTTRKDGTRKHKIIKVIYGRTKDRWSQLIHDGDEINGNP